MRKRELAIEQSNNHTRTINHTQENYVVRQSCLHPRKRKLSLRFTPLHLSFSHGLHITTFYNALFLTPQENLTWSTRKPSTITIIPMSLNPLGLDPGPNTEDTGVSSDMKSVVNTLSIVTALVATITFAAAFAVPGGYRNDGPYQGEPVFIRKVALKVFLFSDTIAFCSSMAATVLLVYASAMAEDGLLFKTVLKRCAYVSGVAVLATMTAFITGVFVLVWKESLWMAMISLFLGCTIPVCVVLCLMLKARSHSSGEDCEKGGVV